MNYKIAVITLLILIFSMASHQVSYSQIEFTEVTNASEWEQLTHKAKKSGKLIFLDVYATWCGPCKYLEKNVYTDPSVGEYYNDKFVNAKMDGETDFGAVFARDHQLEAYPTMFFLTADADLLARIVGVREAGPLKEIGETVKENSDKIAYYEENFPQDNLNLEELRKYQSILSALGQDDKANEVGAAILPGLSEEDIMNPAYKDVILASSPDMHSKVFKILVQHKDKFEETWSKEDLNKLFGEIFNKTLSEAIAKKDVALRDSIISQLLPVYLDKPEDIRSGAYITKKIFFANTDQWKDYGELVSEQYNAEHKGDPAFLYSEAYEVANNFSYSEDALGYALSWVNQAIELDRSFDNILLAAYINGMKGNFDQANKYVAEAENMELTEEQKTMLNELKKVIVQASEQTEKK